MKKIADHTNDPYILALAAGAFYEVKEVKLATRYAYIVTRMQNATSGAVLGAKSSITNSRGKNLILETTSLAAVNWMMIDASLFANHIEKAVKFIMKSVEKGGRYGSTQATVLSLQALVQYTKKFGGIKGKGDFVVSVNNKEINRFRFNELAAQTTNIDFSKALSKYFEKADLTKKYDIKVEVQNYLFNLKNQGFRISYLLEAEYADSQPKSATNSSIKLTLASSASTKVRKLGSISTQNITLENLSGSSQGMAVARVFVPSCQSVENN